MRIGFWFWAGIFLAVPPAIAAPVMESGPGRVSLVELYSSEGCSSCPAADRWFSGLRREPGLWTNFVPLVFHVHYWDDLGWKDVLARPEYTARQQAYAASWGSGSVYTPGVVLNGKEWRQWHSNKSVPAVTAVGGRLKAEAAGGLKFRIRYEAGAPQAGDMKVQGALLGFGIEHDIARGENSGRKLAHDFVVLDLKQANLRQAGNVYEAELVFQAETRTAPQTGAAFWVQSAGNPEPLQAAGGYL